MGGGKSKPLEGNNNINFPEKLKPKEVYEERNIPLEENPHMNQIVEDELMPNCKC